MKAQSKNEQNQPIEKSEIEQLREELKKLQEQVSRQPQSLDEKIQYFQNKKDLIKKLETLDGYTKTLETVTEEVTKAAGENGFFTEAFTLKVVRKVSYRDDVEVLKVQNPTVINEVLGFALASINAKREDLKNLINA